MFDLLFELDRHPSGRAVPRFALPPPDDNMPPPDDGREFDVFFNVFVEDAGWAAHTAHFSITDGQPASFSSVVVGPPQSPAFHVTFDVNNSGTVVSDKSLFKVKISADFTPVPEATSIVIWSLIGLTFAGVGWLVAKAEGCLASVAGCVSRTLLDCGFPCHGK